MATPPPLDLHRRVTAARVPAAVGADHDAGWSSGAGPALSAELRWEPSLDAGLCVRQTRSAYGARLASERPNPQRMAPSTAPSRRLQPALPFARAVRAAPGRGLTEDARRAGPAAPVAQGVR